MATVIGPCSPCNAVRVSLRPWACREQAPLFLRQAFQHSLDVIRRRPCLGLTCRSFDLLRDALGVEAVRVFHELDHRGSTDRSMLPVCLVECRWEDDGYRILSRPPRRPCAWLSSMSQM